MPDSIAALNPLEAQSLFGKFLAEREAMLGEHYPEGLPRS
jgi:hypothetical protein